jgi:hypothetical protein
MADKDRSRSPWAFAKAFTLGAWAATAAVEKPWHELYDTQPGVKGSISHELGYGPYQWADCGDPNEAMFVREGVQSCYAGAFADPPYSVKLDPRELQDLFLAVDEVILHRPTDRTHILFWRGGRWSDYFLAGLDWWGAWATTLNRSDDEIVVICASASD